MPAASLEQQVRQRIETINYLPTTTAVAMKFIELGKNPDAEPNDYGKVVSSDSSLSSKLLALANSSFFGVRNRVTKPQMAVNLLGLGTVRTLAISYCMTGVHNDLRLTSEESRMFWSASLCKGIAAKQFARHFDEKLGEEAFASALFQDFALPIMYAVAKEPVLALLQDASLNVGARLEAERKLFQLDHAEIGRLVAQKIELPDIFVDAVAFHHSRQTMLNFAESRIMADALHVAALFPHLLEKWNQSDAEELRAFIREATGEKPLEVEGFLDSVQKELEQLYRFFESSDAPPEIRLREMMENATREMADSTTRLMQTVHGLLQEAACAGQQVHSLLQQNQQLEDQATKDPLTGALNRDGLMARAKEVLGKAVRYGSPYAIGYLDLDHFKSLNDTFGHPAGDAGLKKLVEIAGEVGGTNVHIGRMGGDEFAVILTECPWEKAKETVQAIVQRFGEAKLTRGEKVAQATASAGIVCVPARTPGLPLESLLAAADKLMYQAKGAGGNRVELRVFGEAKAA